MATFNRMNAMNAFNGHLRNRPFAHFTHFTFEHCAVVSGDTHIWLPYMEFGVKAIWRNIPDS